MTTPPLLLDATLPEADRAFALRAQQRLRASEALDYVESTRLAAARARAMSSVVPDRQRPAASWLAVAATIAVMAILMFPRAAQTPVSAPAALAAVNQTGIDALNWIAEPAGPQFYRDLAFYEWLQNQASHKPNA